MLLTRHKLTIALVIASAYSAGIWAEEVPKTSDTVAINLANIIAADESGSSRVNLNAELPVPLISTTEPALLTVLAPIAIDTQNASIPEQTSIISIEPAPKDATPLLKTASSLGNPQKDLWARIRVGFSLSDLDTRLVEENINWYASRPEYMARMLERSKRYLFYIVEAVEQRGMPTEIALLPMVESAFNPKAYSSAHAAGLWQFMPSTGRRYGLQQNWWVDNRRDVISATNADLSAMIKAGSFREDLLYRLNVIQLNLPPLAERPDDILPLAYFFLESGKTLDLSAQTVLLRHTWPGNVRELKNVMQRACLLSSGEAIKASDLGLPDALITGFTSEAELDRDSIEQALAKSNGVIAQAAAQLGLSRQALYRRMDRLGISRT